MTVTFLELMLQLKHVLILI